MRALEQLNFNDLNTTRKYSLILVIPHYVLLKLLHFIHTNWEENTIIQSQPSKW